MSCFILQKTSDTEGVSVIFVRLKANLNFIDRFQ